MKRLTPFCAYVLNNFPLIEQWFDGLTNYEIMCKLAGYVKELADNQNELSDEVQKLIEWTETLDLQDEVDNKLDEMAEDGTLAEIINQEIFTELNTKVQVDNLKVNDECKIYSMYRGQNTGDSFLIQEAGKNILIDIGTSGTALASWLINKNITKIDYLILSHYHNDHVGGEGASGFISLINSESIDFSECVFYLPHKGIDWSEIVTPEKTDIMANETAVKGAISAKGLTYIEPDNLQKLILNSICNLTFLNIGSEYYSSYYGASSNEYNNFSMVVELQHNNRYALFTGDITDLAESNIVTAINQPDILKAPHHDLEGRSAETFLKKMTPKVMIFAEWNIDGISYPGIATQLTQAVKNNQGNIYDLNNSQDVLIILKNDSIIENASRGVFTNNNVSSLNSCGIHLAENTDLNNVIIPGTYFTDGYLETITLLNSPTRVWNDETHTYTLGRCRVEVIAPNGNFNIVVQYFITANDTYMRSYNVDHWTEWNLISNDNPLGLSAKILSDNTDLNDVINVGKYVIKSDVSYQTMTNTPEEHQAGSMLFVMQTRFINDVRCQILICATDNIYIRHANMNEYSTSVNNWSDWKKVTSATIE